MKIKTDWQPRRLTKPFKQGNKPKGNDVHSKAMKLGMFACCIVMVVPIVAYFAAGGALAGVTGNIAAFVPLLLCAGMHLLMFKLMGKSCHDAEKTTEQEAVPETVVERPTDIPATGASALSVLRS